MFLTRENSPDGALYIALRGTMEQIRILLYMQSSSTEAAFFVLCRIWLLRAQRKRLFLSALVKLLAGFAGACCDGLLVGILCNDSIYRRDRPADT